MIHTHSVNIGIRTSQIAKLLTDTHKHAPLSHTYKREADGGSPTTHTHTPAAIDPGISKPCVHIDT